ncbi:MAG: penicillin-insensitive murein endopeptidase [Kofleriaceae bacterium]
MRIVLWALLIAAPASAERYIVQAGETVENAAASHGCSTELVERINHLDTSIVRPGTVIEVPHCTIASRSRTRARRAYHGDGDGDGDGDAKARQALAVIDGATWITPEDRGEPHDRASRIGAASTASHALDVPRDRDRARDGSIGVPWAGALAHAAKLEAGDGYVVRRPSRAFGAKHVVAQLRAAIGEVRALYPGLPTLAIGDLSAEHGGRISDHRSHQSGLDVDVGFYFTKLPAGPRAGFTEANAALDLEATWALLAAFARTAALADGVQMIFLDYDVQRRLYDFARRRGTPERELDFMFQYPHGRDELTGLVRHWPGHANHMHVRFKPEG